MPEYVYHYRDRKHVRLTLEAHGWIIRYAAKALGVSRQTLYGTMKRLRIKREPMSPAYLSQRATKASAAWRKMQREGR